MTNNRRFVQSLYPAAKLRVVKDYPRVGDLSYRVMDGERPIGRPEYDPTTAWREAERLLCGVPSRDVMASAMHRPMTDEEYKESVNSWIAAESKVD